MFNVDKGLTLTAMDKIEALVASTGATFWIEHDAALFQTLSLTPEYYRWRLQPMVKRLARRSITHLVGTVKSARPLSEAKVDITCS